MSTWPVAGAPLPDYASSLAGVARRIDSAAERHFWRCTLVFLLVFTACAIALDFRMKMWNDEVVTLYVAQQGSPAEIVAATKDGMDATPPLYPIMVAAILPVVRPDALAVRLLSTLGFAGMLLAVLAFCHRRHTSHLCVCRGAASHPDHAASMPPKDGATDWCSGWPRGHFSAGSRQVRRSCAVFG